MRRVLLLFFIFSLSCTPDYPKEFSEPALLEMVIAEDGEKLTFREILYRNRGKKIFINFWASWCKDCINDFPDLKKMQEQYPEVVFVYLSTDFGKIAWKKAIKTYNLKGQHYNLPLGMNKGDLVSFIKLKSISRYMVIDEKGQIIMFKSNKSTDKALKKALAL